MNKDSHQPATVAAVVIMVLAISCSPPYSELERQCVAEGMATIHEARKIAVESRDKFRQGELKPYVDRVAGVMKERVVASASLNGCPPNFLTVFESLGAQAPKPTKFDRIVAKAKAFADQMEIETGPLPNVDYRGDIESVHRDFTQAEMMEILSWHRSGPVHSVEEMTCVRRAQTYVKDTVEDYFHAENYKELFSKLLLDYRVTKGCPKAFEDVLGSYMTSAGKVAFIKAGFSPDTEAVAAARKAVFRYGYDDVQEHPSAVVEQSPTAAPGLQSDAARCVAIAQKQVEILADKLSSEIKSLEKGDSDVTAIEEFLAGHFEVVLDDCPDEFVDLHSEIAFVWEDYLATGEIQDAELTRRIASRLYAFQVEG